MTSVSKIADVLGGEGVLGRRLGTPQELRRAVAEGLPKRSLSHMAKLVVQDPKQQRMVVHRIVPEATFKRRRDRLSLAESERAERTARVAAMAFDLWGEEDGRAFLSNPHPMLGGETPLEAAATDLGAREVETILRALEFGLPA
ncbi:MAG: antitoxin Xre/MbcA/ParS toxin-binding domain-containing protein [Microvirga sp.]|jgi:putative toxin-antitoxin system antitoxin component (TIGR02293 family)